MKKKKKKKKKKKQKKKSRARLSSQTPSPLAVYFSLKAFSIGCLFQPESSTKSTPYFTNVFTKPSQYNLSDCL